MKANIGRFLVGVSIMLTAIAILPNASAAPTVLPLSSSALTVANTDSVSFGVFTFGSIGQTITITSPDGTEMTLLVSGIPDTNGGQVWSLNGTQISGETGIVTTVGNLVSHPADGTWLISASAVPLYAATWSMNVGSKSLIWSVYGSFPDTANQFWNWRSTATNGTYIEASTVPMCATPCNDPPNEDNREDPNNAVFFNDNSGAIQSPFTAYTLNYGAPTCGQPANVTVTGAWLGGNSTLFSRFIYREGNFLGTTDLRTVAGFSNTTPENEGNVSNGTDSKSILYGNGAGTSYQFIVNTTTQGEALGQVQWIPSGLCSASIPSIINLLHDENEFQITASQAQCRDDFVSFEVTTFALGAGSGLGGITVTVYDSATGTPRYTTNQAAMHVEGAFPILIHSFQAVYAPGAYVALARLDITGGVGVNDFVDAVSFNVPRGPCTDTPTDLTPVLLALTNLSFNITGNFSSVVSAIENITQVYNFTGNNTFNIDNGTLNNILQNVTDHRNNTLEVNMTSNFNGLGFDGLIFLFFWIAVILFATYQEWWFVLGFALPGLFDMLFPAQIPGDFTEYLIFCLLGFVLELAANHFSWGAYRSKRHDGDT